MYALNEDYFVDVLSLWFYGKIWLAVSNSIRFLIEEAVLLCFEII